jgi:hypothetical protein
MAMKKIPVLLAICLSLIGINASATTVERLGLDDLVKKAHSIVVGKVMSSRTYWTSNGKLILTDFTLDVGEQLKGSGPRRVVVTTIGGKIGNTELHVSGMPMFKQGEDAVVFIEQSGAYETVVGLGQGKFTVMNGEVTNALGGLAFPDGRPGNATRMPIDSFKAQIRNFLNR